MYQNEMSTKGDSHLPHYLFEAVIGHPYELEQLLGKDLLFCFYDLDGQHEFSTCYGDICKTINALMDYSRILEMVCDQWRLEGCHRAIYEYQAGKLREIAKKYQNAIGYDYDAALERCRKKQERQTRENDIGDEALVQALRRKR